MSGPQLPDRALVTIMPGVGLCLVDGSGRLILHRRHDSNQWAPPSGAIEPGESIFAAARREALEETGLEIQIERFVGVYSDPTVQIVQRAGRQTHFITTLIAAKVGEGPLQGSSEGTEWGYFSADQMPHDLTPYARVWIADWLDGFGAHLR